MQKRFNQVNVPVDIRTLKTATRVDGPEGRVYVLPSGKTVPSVTTVLGWFRNDTLENWKKRVGEIQAARVSRHAADKGSAFHSMVESYVKNVPLKRIYEDHMPTTRQRFLDCREVLDNDIDNIWFTEQPIYSDKLFVAGTVDLVAEYKQVNSTIDFKTSRYPKTEKQITHYFEQASGYNLMIEHMTGVKIKQIVIIIAVDNDKPQIFVKNPDEFKSEFIKKVAIYHMANK